jgi:hypothetical protein
MRGRLGAGHLLFLDLASALAIALGYVANDMSEEFLEAEGRLRLHGGTISHGYLSRR